MPLRREIRSMTPKGLCLRLPSCSDSGHSSDLHPQIPPLPTGAVHRLPRLSRLSQYPYYVHGSANGANATQLSRARVAKTQRLPLATSSPAPRGRPADTMRVGWVRGTACLRPESDLPSRQYDTQEGVTGTDLSVGKSGRGCMWGKYAI